MDSFNIRNIGANFQMPSISGVKGETPKIGQESPIMPGDQVIINDDRDKFAIPTPAKIKLPPAIDTEDIGPITLEIDDKAPAEYKPYIPKWDPSAEFVPTWGYDNTTHEVKPTWGKSPNNATLIQDISTDFGTFETNSLGNHEFEFAFGPNNMKDLKGILHGGEIFKQ